MQVDVLLPKHQVLHELLLLGPCTSVIMMERELMVEIRLNLLYN